MAGAFRRLGHEVRTIGQSTGNRIPWGPDGWLELDPKYAWQPDAGLEEPLDGYQPDLIVHMDSAFEFRHPLYGNVPHVIFGVDNHVREYSRRNAERLFLAHKGVSRQPFGDDTEWLPCGYDPAVFKPSPIAWDERAYEVCMIGVLYPPRLAVIDALAKAGIRVFYGVGLVYDEFAAAYQNSRISLCVSAAGDVSQRIFETAAMGCAVLSDHCADLKELGATFATFGSAAEAVELARHLLGSGARSSGSHIEWARPHTWDARAARIVRWWETTYASA